MLLANKLHSSLTILGLIIGNASVIAMVGVGAAAQKLATSELESFGPNMLYIIPDNRNLQRATLGKPRTLVLSDAEAIANQVPSIQAVAPQIREKEFVTYSNKNIKAQLVGTTPEFLVVRNFKVAAGGNFFTAQDLTRSNQVVVIGPELAKRLFEDQNPIGRKLRIKGVSFQVIGVMEPKGSLMESNQDEAAFIPLTTMVNRLVGKTSPYGIEVSTIAFSAKDKNSVRAAQFQVSNLLRLRHKITDSDDFIIHSQKKFLQTSNLIAIALTITLAAIASISLLVAGIGIMNIMLMSVKARTSEIGLRKAVGACQQDILIQFLIEAVILSVAGGFIGTIIGASGVILIGAVTPLNTGVSAITIALTVGVSGSIGLFFGVVPARQAAKLDPIVALRSS
ncbi:MAG: ABC transporter permease [Xenococcus sp. MO_188.B8]|nr:ABC transporter permease [Xenococcus sp. MO_188.B8]